LTPGDIRTSGGGIQDSLFFQTNKSHTNQNHTSNISFIYTRKNRKIKSACRRAASSGTYERSELVTAGSILPQQLLAAPCVDERCLVAALLS